MQAQLIEALADVLGVDLTELQGMTQADALAMLEAKQAEELAQVIA